MKETIREVAQEAVMQERLGFNLLNTKSMALLKLEDKKYVQIDFKRLLYIEAFDKLSLLNFEDGTCITCRSPLYKVQNMLPSGFERVHRAYIVNINHINYVDVNSKSVCLKNDFSLSFGLSYKESIQKYFVNLHENLI
ncbi:MAG: LytTR family DNA-binding domain-containing protein [Bacteroidota bacterium]